MSGGPRASSAAASGPHRCRMSDTVLSSRASRSAAAYSPQRYDSPGLDRSLEGSTWRRTSLASPSALRASPASPAAQAPQGRARTSLSAAAPSASASPTKAHPSRVVQEVGVSRPRLEDEPLRRSSGRRDHAHTPPPLDLSFSLRGKSAAGLQGGRGDDAARSLGIAPADAAALGPGPDADPASCAGAMFSLEALIEKALSELNDISLRIFDEDGRMMEDVDEEMARTRLLLGSNAWIHPVLKSADPNQSVQAHLEGSMLSPLGIQAVVHERNQLYRLVTLAAEQATRTEALLRRRTASRRRVETLGARDAILQTAQQLHRAVSAAFAAQKSEIARLARDVDEGVRKHGALGRESDARANDLLRKVSALVEPLPSCEPHTNFEYHSSRRRICVRTRCRILCEASRRRSRRHRGKERRSCATHWSSYAVTSRQISQFSVKQRCAISKTASLCSTRESLRRSSRRWCVALCLCCAVLCVVVCVCSRLSCRRQRLRQERDRWGEARRCSRRSRGDMQQQWRTSTQGITRR